MSENLSTAALAEKDLPQEAVDDTQISGDDELPKGPETALPRSQVLLRIITLLQDRGLVSKHPQEPSYTALTKVNGNVLATGESFNGGPVRELELEKNPRTNGYSDESTISEIISILKSDLILKELASAEAPKSQTEDEILTVVNEWGQQESSTIVVAPAPGSGDGLHPQSTKCFRLEDFDILCTDLLKACENGIGKDTKYKGVYVLLMSWGEADNLGVGSELDLVEEVFRVRYDFDVQRFVIPNKSNANVHTSARIDKFQLDHEDPNNLFIIYYGGHGVVGQDQCCYFRPNPFEKDKHNFVDWNPIQSRLVTAEQDVLILLDCCSAGAAVTKRAIITSTTEVLGAGAREVEVPGVSLSSFTQRLLHELWYTNDDVLYVDKVAEKLVPEAAEQPNETQPFWWPVNGRDAPSIGLRVANPTARPSKASEKKLRPHKKLDVKINSDLPTKLQVSVIEDDNGSSSQEPWDSSASQTSLTQSRTPGSHGHRALITIHTTKDLAVEKFKLIDWVNWLKRAPDGVVGLKDIKFECLYETGSSLLILSIPIRVWLHLRDDPAYNFIGFIRSSNLLRPEQLSAEGSTLSAVTAPLAIPENRISRIEAGIQRLESYHQKNELRREEHFEGTQETLNKLTAHLNDISEKVKRTPSFATKKTMDSQISNDRVAGIRWPPFQQGKEKQKAREMTLHTYLEEIASEIIKMKDILMEFKIKLRLESTPYPEKKAMVTGGNESGAQRDGTMSAPSASPLMVS